MSCAEYSDRVTLLGSEQSRQAFADKLSNDFAREVGDSGTVYSVNAGEGELPPQRTRLSATSTASTDNSNLVFIFIPFI